MASVYSGYHTVDRTALLRRCALLLSVFTLFWLLLLTVIQTSETNTTFRIDRLDRFDSATSTPPATPFEPSDQRAVTLPDVWQKLDNRLDSVWYYTRFDLAATPIRLWSVYLPDVFMNAAVYINGELIGLEGRLQPPITRNWHRPLFFQIPTGLLRDGTNRLHIHLTSQPSGSGYLGLVYLGPSITLSRCYQNDYLFQVTLVQMSVIGTLTMAFFMFVLWLMRRQDRVYLWFGIGLVCWAIHNLNIIVSAPPFSPGLWTRLMGITMVWMTICTAFYSLRFLHQSWPRSERTLLLIGMLSCVLAPFLPSALFHPQRWPVYEIVAIVIGLYATGIMLRAFFCRQSLPLEIAIVTALGVCMMSTGGYDFLIITDVIDRGSAYMLPYSAPLVIVGFGFVLLNRFTLALRAAETLNITLEQRVTEKSRELEHKHRLLRQYERRQTLVAERQRIVSDMHDGVGGQLLSTITAIESGHADLADVARSLRDTLNELRLVIDSMDPDIDSLEQLLGLLRERIESRLHCCNIRLEWQVNRLPLRTAPGPHASLQILRIAQEAITNTLKHASASTIIVRTGIEQHRYPARPYIELIDNGCGMGNARSGSGRGLHNMQRRADILGAKLNIESSHRGTRIRLTFEHR